MLGDLQAATGDATAASRQFETVRFIERLGEIASTVYDRSLIRFEPTTARHPRRCSPRPRHRSPRARHVGHDTVAWRCIDWPLDAAAIEIAAAAAEAADARLQFHRGAIELADADAAGGRAALQAALALGPALDPIERAEAQRLLAH